MSLFTECLEASQVDSLLHGNLTPEEYESAQNHLEQCESCRARIESTIGPHQWWNDVQSVLSSDATHVAASLRDAESFHAGEFDGDAASLGETRLRENVLDLLGPTDDPNMLGRIGPYEINGLLGQGGMGAVFKGFDRSLNRFVAIKMLLPHLAASGAARKRFAREGQAVAAVVDDHVMAIHCVDEWQGVPYLVMTYSRGVSLQKRLSDNGPLDVREILRIGMQTAKGLAAAHAQGIVHRDIKPANIFLDQNVERVQLMDFGLARAVDDASLTRTGVLAGTPQYMSPEQARAEAVDHRSDLFSLGSVMYAMCTGHAPFRAESSYGVLRLITDKEPRPIREINPDVPEWLCTIVTKLMSKHASERYQSAKEVSELLEECLAHLQQPATNPLPKAVAALSTIKSRRPPIGKLIAAAAFSFALFFAGVFIVLELNKGTLTIQSDADDARVRITRGDEVIDELKVSKSGQSVRVVAGKYNVEIIGETDELTVVNGQVTLHRAGTETVRIVHNEHSQAENRTSVPPEAGPTRTTAQSLLDKLQGTWHVVEHYYDAGVPKRRLNSATVRGNRMEVSQGQGVRPMKYDLITGKWGPPQQIDLKVAMSELERQRELEDLGDAAKPMPELVLKGIIEVDGDLISICSTISADISHRPVEFIINEDQMLWNFTRAAEHEATREDVGQAKEPLSPEKRTISFESPFQGRLRWGNGIRENAFLKEGDGIAEIIGFDPEVHRQLNGQLSLLKQKAEAEATLVQASEESLKVYRSNVEALESRLKVYEQDQTNEEKRQVDVDRDKDALSRAKAETAKVESELQKAKFDLNVTQKEVADLEAKLVEQKSYVFHAPSSGCVTELCRKELLKKGDVICLFEPESENSPPTKPIAIGEKDKAEQREGKLMTDSNNKTPDEPILHNTIGPPETKYFLILKFYEKRNGSIKHLYSPTIAVVGGKQFECTNAGTIKKSFSGYKVNGVISKFHNDVTFQALLQVVNYSGKFQANENLPISETRTVQLDEVTWVDIRIEPYETDNALKLSAKEVEVVSSLVPTEVTGKGSVTLTQPAEGSKVSSDATIEEWKADRSTPQATLETIDICHLNNPAHVPVDCYTDEALLEMSGVMLQQLGYMSVLSRLYSPLDAQIRIQTGGESDAKDSGPVIPGALPSFQLQVDALLKEHSLPRPSEQCKKAFELLLKSTVASLDGNESRVIPDRQLYRLAAGVLKSTREFLPRANELSQLFRDSSSQADAHSNKVVTLTHYDIVIEGDEAVATTLVDKNSPAIPMRFKLRRVNERWLVSEVFSDQILTQINLSMPQITGDTSAKEYETTKQSPDVSVIQPSTTTVAAKQPLLNTWEEVQYRVAEIVKEREAITNAEVDFKLDLVGEHTSKRRYHVWLNDLHRRADCRGVSSDATEDTTHIVTPKYSWYDDHLDKSKSQLGHRDPKDPVGWGTLGCIVDVRKVGLVNWSIESIDAYEFDHDLLPKESTETFVETGDYEGAPITIVKHRLKSTNVTERWTEYWLSPAHGNYPIYIANGWTEPGNPNLKNVVSQRTQWKLIDGIWFPMSVKHHSLSEQRKLYDTNTFTLIGARFNVNPFPNVFDPSIVDVDDGSNSPLQSWREDFHSKVLSELPESWSDFLALLPKTGTALVMFSDQAEIREQMSPIAREVARGAAVQFIEIRQTAPRADNPPANHFPSTHYLLMKDRHVVDTRCGVLTEEKLREFVAQAADWLTPRSTGVEENSLVRIDCYIYPGTGNIGQQSGDAYPVTAAVVAVHEDQALLLGPDDVAQYMEKGYACVAIVRDADGKEKPFPLEVLFNEPVKLLGRNGEPHRLQVSVRVTHSDGTNSELPTSSLLPDNELMPQPREKYDVDSAIYRIKGVQGLKAVKLAGLGEAISVGERVLSGSFSQKPIVPVVLGFSPPIQWQSQTVVGVDGVTGGNMHGPETFSVLCPSLPVPSGYSFDVRGRLLGKRLGGNPTNEDMTHDVFKSHATHSILRAALDKIDDAGLKAALRRTLQESSSTSEEASVAPLQKPKSNNSQ